MSETHVLRTHLHHFTSAHLPLKPTISNNEVELPHMLDRVSYLPSSDWYSRSDRSRVQCRYLSVDLEIESPFVQSISRMPHEKHLKYHLISNKYKAEGLGPTSLKCLQGLFSKEWVQALRKAFPASKEMNISSPINQFLKEGFHNS